jgi:hypothetical protein
VVWSPVILDVFYHVARVTGDGEQAVFMSRAPLSGNDNADEQSGNSAAEVFRYDATTDELNCLSCIRSGARPTARMTVSSTPYWAASRIPGWEYSNHESRVLSADGSRVFFESFNPLVLADTNGKTDVYQWQQVGTGECEEADSSFDPKAGGCVSLISSGTAAKDTRFVDASASGDDVFIETPQSLLSTDPDNLVDIYDARVEGGFAALVSPLPCEGDACQGNPAAAPSAPAPATSVFSGPGNQGRDRTQARKPCARKGRKGGKGKKRRCAKRGSGRERRR